MRLPVLASLLACGCFYSFPIEQKTACPVSGSCDEGFACLGGICVDASRARCTAFDRRCVGQVAWTCASDGSSETGEDCAAAGKVCASGSCLSPCGAGCPAKTACDAAASACVPTLACAAAKDCDATRGEQCYDGVCVAQPSDSVPQAQLSCYPSTQPATAFAGKVVGLAGPGIQASGTLLLGGGDNVAFASDTTGAFTTGASLPAGQLPQVRFDPAFGVVPGLHLGPQPSGAEGELLDLLALTADQAQGLVASEAPQDGPAWDISGRGIIVGHVRDCDGYLMQGVTVGYSVPVGRQGYLGTPGAQVPQLQRQGASATVKGLGSFVAFDVPIGVDIQVVAVALQRDPAGTISPVVIFSQTVSVEKPSSSAVAWGLTTLDAGRGAPAQ